MNDPVSPGEVVRLRHLIETQRVINTATLDGDAVMRIVAESAQTITGGSGGVVELVEGDEVVFRAATGLAAPDQLLRLCAAEFSGVVRRCDTVARVGGDEFVIVCSDADPKWEESIVDRVRTAVAQAARCLPFTAAVSVSAGVVWSDGDDPVAALLSRADASMSAAKRCQPAEPNSLDYLL